MNNRFVQKAGLAISLAMTGTLIAGCRGDLSASSGGTSSVETSVITGSGGATTSGTAVNDAFWVKPYFDPAKPSSIYKFYLHEQSSAYNSASCQVTSSSTLKDIYCYLDVNELDLNFNGVSFVFNAPVGMCSYTALKLYAFYFLPAGYYTPPAVTIAKDATGAVTGVTFSSGGAGVPTTGAAAVPINAAGTAPVCPFDYSESGGPNCCEGNYTVTVNQAGTPGTSFTLNGKFGGKISNCIVGPGKDYKQAAGYPAEEISRTSLTGGNTLVNVSAPLFKTNPDGLPYSGNVFVANYFNPVSFGYGGTPTWPVSNTNWPRAITGALSNTMTAIVGTRTYAFSDGFSYMSPPMSMSPYYEYGCLDEDHDYIARIRLFVNSWDTLAGWTATSNPYSVGAEASFPEYSKHDYSVWEDILNNFPGLYL